MNFQNEYNGFAGSEVVATLLMAWPRSIDDVAESIGIEKSSLEAYLKHKVPIDPPVLLYLLLDYFQIEKFEPLNLGEPLFYETTGPYLLICSDLKGARKIYEEVSHGGDLAVSTEIVPETDIADPMWRYLVFEPCGCFLSVMMIPRGSSASTLLDRIGDLINFSGISTVSNKLYRDIVRSCGMISGDKSASPGPLRRIYFKYQDELEELNKFGMYM